MRNITSITNVTRDIVIAPVIANLAEVPQQLSISSAKLGTTALLELTKSFISNNIKFLFREFIERARNLLVAGGMIIKAVSVNFDPNRNLTNQRWNPKEVGDRN